MDPTHLEAIARAIHEANLAYCLANGDTSQPPWDEIEEWQRQSSRNAVMTALGGATPEQQHEAWMAERQAAGWTLGPVKDTATKTHPCLVPYDQLPPAQRAKDALVGGVARAMAAALGIVDGR